MPPLGDADIEDAKQKAAKACEIPESYKYTMGTPALDSLWQATGDLTGLEGLTDPMRYVHAYESLLTCLSTWLYKDWPADWLYPDTTSRLLSHLDSP